MKDIFDKTAEAADCLYISNLHMWEYWKPAISYLLAHVGSFSLCEMSDICGYMFDEKVDFKDESEVKTFLKKKLHS